MKKVILVILCALTLNVFAQAPAPVEKTLAKVDNIEGMLIFVNSTPVAEYQYLGTVKFANTFSLKESQYTHQRDVLIKRAKEKYPEANGLIFHFVVGSPDTAEAIKFK